MSLNAEDDPTKILEAGLTELSNANIDVVRMALSEGFSAELGNYSENIKTELSKAHRAVVEEVLANSDKLTALQEAIIQCDKVFENLEQVLRGFQNDLGSISEDMKSLQSQSATKNQELENRQKVRGEISQFVDDIVVPQQMVKMIIEQDANDRTFLENLHELHRKILFIQSQEHKEARAIHDVEPVLESLRIKAIEKCREWILLKIYQFRKPLSNYQVPQHQMLKSRFFYEFLIHHEAVIAAEVQDEYVDTVGKMFFSYFKVYTSRLFKLLMTDSASKEDLLGTEDTHKTTGISTFFGAKPQVRNRATVFSLGRRHELLRDQFLAPLIIPHAAKELNEKFQFESLFRSIHFALVDHCSHEFLFITDFFLVSGPIAVEMHKRIMHRALTQLLRAFDEKIMQNYDAISLYLCICLATKFKNLLTERETPTNNWYWDEITNRLWQRFDQVMSLHNESVKSLDVKKMHLDTRPNYIVRRYAELTCALLVISEVSNSGVEGRLESVLESNEDSIEQLLGRMASTWREPRERLVCLINNYDLILGILDERVTMNTRIRTIVYELSQKAASEFVELSLAPYFTDIISLVTECEPLIEQQAAQLLVRYNEKLTAVIRHFAQTWKASIDQINGDIVKSFTNFKNGTTILQSAFTQFVSMYQRFVKMAGHDAFRECPARNDLINIHHIMIELKKYKPVY
ncbi:unnamed protein product, partial [Mesorhabditis spiculigera]